MRVYRNRKTWIISIGVVWCTLITLAGVVGVSERAIARTAGPSAIETVSSQQITNSFVVDHRYVDAAGIPQDWLDEARALDTFFSRMSLGNNILLGMDDMETQDPGRYSIAVASAGSSWFGGNDGILHQSAGTNTQPFTKINQFDDYIRNDGYHIADMAMVKFCPSDVPPFSTTGAANTWAAYRDMMEALERDYPGVIFVWWTFPLSGATDGRGNDEKAVFNAAIRSYCAANGCVLFDIADIQSHDPSGNPVVDSNGYEAMWDGYTDDGGHFNGVGRLRAANAFWWLLARATVDDLPNKVYLPIVMR